MQRPRLALALTALAAAPAAAQHVTPVIDRSGDGRGNPLEEPYDLALDEDDNLYVVGIASDNVFRVTPDGAVETILDASGDGQGHALDGPTCVAVQRDHVYVGAIHSRNLFRLPPDGPPAVLLDGFAPGPAEGMRPVDVALDEDGNVFVLSSSSGAAVLRLAPDGSVTTVLPTFSPAGQVQSPRQLALSPSGNVYVADAGVGYPFWGGVFRVAPDGEITKLMDFVGGFHSPYAQAFAIAVTDDDTLYVTTDDMCSVVRIAPDGTLDTLHEEEEFCLDWTLGLAIDRLGYPIVASLALSNDWGVDVRRYHATDGYATPILHAQAFDPDDLDPLLLRPRDLVLDSSGRMYVSGEWSDTVYRIDEPQCGPSTPKATLRPGSGANPAGLSEITPAVAGSLWKLRVASDLPGPLASVLLLSATGPLPPVATPFGELLIAPPFHRHVAPFGPPPRRHNVALPFDCATIGHPISIQAALVQQGPLRVQLQNAIDGEIGTLSADG